MAEVVPASLSGSAGGRSLHSGIIQWLVDNFCVCEGCSVPRCLMYEMYVETYGQDAQNQVNPAMFGKVGLMAVVGHHLSDNLYFPGITMMESVSRKARSSTPSIATFWVKNGITETGVLLKLFLCCLLCHSGDIAAFEKSTNYNSILQEEGACDSRSPIKTDPAGPPLYEFRRCPFWEQELAKKYSCTTVGPHAPGRRSCGAVGGGGRECPLVLPVIVLVADHGTGLRKAFEEQVILEGGCKPKDSPCPSQLAFLADKYCGYCQDVLQNVRNQDLEKVGLCLQAPSRHTRSQRHALLHQVEDSLTSFWKSLQQDTVMLLSLPDVCQLFKCYDVQLYKGIEDVLLRDFLEDVSLQYLKSVRLFSKKFKLWLLTALEGFPALLQISKLKGRFP
ncbi:DNA-binding protein RFX8 [Camelus dromedarius]|uniref:DNA-binding protein RFX8 n=1 Tax=Camelus dromedarius TaxID=9838 RepID=A0A5N4CD52_CAMDR|nr:DNA-binding protein RFX8 [Camelus dromedarius]